jgi:hypothetical protein
MNIERLAITKFQNTGIAVSNPDASRENLSRAQLDELGAGHREPL